MYVKFKNKLQLSYFQVFMFISFFVKKNEPKKKTRLCELAPPPSSALLKQHTAKKEFSVLRFATNRKKILC